MELIDNTCIRVYNTLKLSYSPKSTKMKKVQFSIVFLAILISCKQPPESLPPVKNPHIAFGIDASHNQGTIDWVMVSNQKKYAPVEFVILRSTMGEDRIDKKFRFNWESAEKQGLIIGAYHYYDPNQNSIKQAENYLKTVKLQSGNFIPIVDIERLSRVQSNKKLCAGLKRWLNRVEKCYGVRPMIYTGHSFFNDYLCKEFAEYPLWVAAYSTKRRTDTVVRCAKIHQFSETISLPGITENTVDGNDIKRENIDTLLIK